MTNLRKAWDRAVMRAESRSWIRGLLGRINDDASFTVAVPERPNYVYVRLGQTGTGDLTVARNDAGIQVRGNLPVRMRYEDGILVVRGFDGDSNYIYSTTEGSMWVPDPDASPGDPFEHSLDGVYHTGSLSWSKVSKTGSALDDLASRPHSHLTNIGENDHHDKATGGNGIVMSGDGGQVVGVDLAVDPGLEFDAGKLRARVGNGLARDGSGTYVDLDTDPGLEFATGKLRAKPGDGITRTSAGLNVDLSPTSGLALVGTSPGKTLELADSVAGNGLVIESKVLRVPVANTLAPSNTASPGLTVESDLIRLTYSSNPGANLAPLASSSNGALQLVTLASNVAYFSGFTGAGYRIDHGITEDGKSSAEFDNLTVRGRMRVYELLIQQIRATNGSVFVSSASRAEQITEDNAWEVNGEQLTFNGANATFDLGIYQIDTRADADEEDHNLYHGFVVGDLIRAQRFEMDVNGNFAQVRVSNLQVTGVTDLYRYTAALANGDPPVEGDDLVRLGNTTDTTRQGSVYITADDSNAPYIDIVNDIASHADWNTAGKVKARIGRLTGITDSDFGGNLEGYGLYGNNVYLRGRMVVTAGKIGEDNGIVVSAGTTVIDGNKITTGAIQSNNWQASEGSRFDLTNGTFYLGGSTAPKLSWNGTNLSIVGSITLTAPIPSGDVTGLGTLAALNSVDLATGQVTNKSLANLDSAANTKLGGIQAGATVGAAWGTNLTGRPVELTDGRIATALNAAGTVVTRVVPAAAAAASAAGLYLGSDRMGYYNGSAWRTYMDNSGNFYLAGAGGNALAWDGSTLSIVGTINSSEGFIGGWQITANGIVGSTVGLSTMDTHAIWAGHGSAPSAPFFVTQTGSMKATLGTIGGWTIGTTAISSTNILLQSGTVGNARLEVGTSTNQSGIVSTSASGDVAFWSGAAYANRANANFRVTAGGALFCNSVNVTGTVTASAGAITGDLTVGGRLRSGKSSYTDATAGWWLGTDGSTPRFHIGNSDYFLRWTGTDLEINQAKINAPSITSAWTTVSSYGTGWSAWDASNPLRYTRIGELVMVVGWIKVNTSTSNATICTGLPGADIDTFVTARSNIRPDLAGGGDTIRVGTNGTLTFFGDTSTGTWNLNLIVNVIYKATV